MEGGKGDIHVTSKGYPGRVQIVVNPEDWQKFTNIAAVRGVSKSSILRLMVRDFVRDLGGTRPKGTFSDGRK